MKENLKGFLKFLHSTAGEWVLFLVFVLVIAAFLTVVWERFPSNIGEGSFATRDILSDRDYTIVDVQATEELRRKAREKIVPVFALDATHYDSVAKRVRDAFSKTRNSYNSWTPQEVRELTPVKVEKLRTLFTDTLGVSLSVRDFQTLFEAKFNVLLEDTLLLAIEPFLTQPVVKDETVLEPYMKTGIVFVSGKKDQIIPGNKLSQLLTTGDVFEKMEIFDARLRESTMLVLRVIADGLIVPTATFNAEETKERQDKEAGGIQDVIVRVQAGESIIRRGDRFRAQDISIIEGIRRAKVRQNFRWQFLGVTLWAFVFLFSIHFFAKKFLFRFRPKWKDLIFLGSCLVVQLAIFRFGISIGRAISDALPFTIPPSALYYVLPVAACVTVARLVRSSTEAFLLAVASAGLLAFAPDMEISYIAYYLFGGIAVSIFMAGADSRAAILKGGVIVGLLQVVLVVAFEMARSIEIMVSLSGESLLWNAGFAFIGGVSISVASLVFMPVAESLFGYLTAIKLLELGSLNHPLLRELIVRAPGTYHHSHLVGVLAEAGCRAIGADGLFARVASYFHDVGKVVKPDYFSENQPRGSNLHDSLAPSMSALIVENHVKDGIDVATRYRLPKQIIDIIPQHQGTKLIRYFYSKAKEKGEPISEKDYRYQGPKPQTREAGVIMLADSVEAATRSLPDKSLPKVKGVVENIINQNFTDGQLDECELTLKGLHEIAGCFTDILVGIYHRRVEYPEFSVYGKEGDDYHTKPQPIQGSYTEDVTSIADHLAKGIKR